MISEKNLEYIPGNPFLIKLFVYSRLSERNVIEIVSKLVELRLIEVIYTVDGKEYLTPHELEKEIREELAVHGGKQMLLFLGLQISRCK